MNTMVSLGFVQACIFAFLACLCVAIYFGLRRQSSLAWLAAALLIGSIAVLVLGQFSGTFLEQLAVTLLVPSGYLCLGQSVGLAVGERRRSPGLLAAVAGLAGVSFVLLLAGIPFIYQTLPFQLACGLAVSDGFIRLFRAPGRSALDICLMFVVAGIASAFFLRLPFFPVLFDSAASYLSIRDSSFEQTLLRFNAIVTPTAVFLLLAKIVGGVITTYRTRSERDGLTGLFNRLAFDEMIRADPSSGGALILCDIDYFKQVNDRYGHHAGDEILCSFAKLLARAGQPAARVGGEEFALLLPRRGVAEAAELAEMVRARFHAAGHPLIAADHRLSASFGVASYEPGDLLRDVLTRADSALYRAKHNGRNRVETYEDGLVPILGGRQQAA
ncbi:GGDEF domain-containing protein [Bosea caraganae]|nr:GGDEF domain-containing protein [Bosea caraganae]